jgi:hypothetical protein
VKCSSCRSRYSAAWRQPAPGGSSAPGIFLMIALGLVAIALLTIVFGHVYIGFGCLAISAFVFIQVPIAWSDCRGKVGLSPNGGGNCPNCGADNRVRLWSM